MVNSMTRKSVAIVSKLLALTAVLFVSTASVYWFHRPKTPAELLKK